MAVRSERDLRNAIVVRRRRPNDGVSSVSNVSCQLKHPRASCICPGEKIAFCPGNRPDGNRLAAYRYNATTVKFLYGKKPTRTLRCFAESLTPKTSKAESCLLGERRKERLFSAAEFRI